MISSKISHKRRRITQTYRSFSRAHIYIYMDRGRDQKDM